MNSPVRLKERRLGAILAIAIGAAIVLILAAHFPYDVDKPLSPEEVEKTRKHWTDAYQKETADKEQPIAKEGASRTPNYEKTFAKLDAQVKTEVSDFASRYGLDKGAVLDIGSGRGYLQDVVENYTGLDISSSAARYYHKKFVLGSATAMPFPDDSFDGGWSIFVLEHVPNPEQALVEIRRVMKNNAIVYLKPAWNCTSWAAAGYDVRPYSDFDWKGRLIKASIPVRASAPFRIATRVPIRILRSVAAWTGPSRLHYRLLQPNYREYWEPDSDALNAIDPYEMLMWFRTRGDECLNCKGLAGSVLMRIPAPLVIQIHK